MSLLYVVGGRQKPSASEQEGEWRHYGQGLILAVDQETGVLDPMVEYTSSPDVCPPDDPSILFKTGTLVGHQLYAPTQTEVLVFDVRTFEQTGYVSLPRFNDVHHVRPHTSETLLVANTGLDMVVEVGLDGTVHREWSVFGGDPWGRFSTAVDYRKVATTKPHRSHPNHVFLLDSEIWVTRYEQMDAVCLTHDSERIPVADKWIHDGLVHGDTVYFTAVNGQVIEVDAVRRTVRNQYDLNGIDGRGMPLGWCRGLEVLDDDHVVVGFSRLRPTKWKRNVQWVKRRLGGGGGGLLPTRLAMFDLRRRKRCWELDLEPGGMNAVFSIHRPLV